MAALRFPSADDRTQAKERLESDGCEIVAELGNPAADGKYYLIYADPPDQS